MGRICGVSRYRGVLRSIARERSFSHYREDEITAGEISASFASLLRRCCCCCCCRSRHIHRSHSNTLSHRRAHIHHTPSQIHKIEWTRQRHQRHRQRRLIGRQRDHPVCSRYSSIDDIKLPLSRRGLLTARGCSRCSGWVVVLGHQSWRPHHVEEALERPDVAQVLLVCQPYQRTLPFSPALSLSLSVVIDVAR